jgi:5-methylcytosine-specific restriction endonuclease McrA
VGRPSGPKVRCGNQWTEARFTTFVKNLLRSGTRKWAPIQNALKKARTRRGYYLCADCGEEVTATIKHPNTGRRTKNAIVDHINPVIDPKVGFTSWDDFVEGTFCEIDNLQVVCYACHKGKTDEETAVAAARRREEKGVE